VVIACSKCQTRFHVEDARVPEAGVRVRCSKCKHTFFVRPPHAPADAGVHAAAEAAISEAVAAPEPSFDLEGSTAPPSEAIDRSAFEEEDDWQFAIDPPSAAAERSAPADPAPSDPLPKPSLSSRAEERRTVEEPETSSLADLESPESWNLLGGPALGDTQPEPAVEAELEESEAADILAELPDEEEFAPPPREPRERSAGVGLAAQVLGWIALAGLLGAVGRGLLIAPMRHAGSFSGPVAVAGLEAREIRGRMVDNALVGPLFVVTGTLTNAGSSARVPERAIRVVPLDAAAQSLPGAILAGAPLSPEEVRRGDPAQLRVALERSAGGLARRPLAAGEGVPFQAVFESLDPAAVAFRLEDAAPPAPSPLPMAPAAEPADATEPYGSSEAAANASPS